MVVQTKHGNSKYATLLSKPSMANLNVKLLSKQCITSINVALCCPRKTLPLKIYHIVVQSMTIIVVKAVYEN